jgi:hypothetical protein
MIRLTSSMRARLRSVVRPLLSSAAHRRATAAFLLVLTSIEPESLAAADDPQVLGAACRGRRTRCPGFSPIRARASPRTEVLLALLDAGHRALARAEQIGQLALGQALVAACVADEGADAVEIGGEVHVDSMSICESSPDFWPLPCRATSIVRQSHLGEIGRQGASAGCNGLSLGRRVPIMPHRSMRIASAGSRQHGGDEARRPPCSGCLVTRLRTGRSRLRRQEGASPRPRNLTRDALPTVEQRGEPAVPELEAGAGDHRQVDVHRAWATPSSSMSRTSSARRREHPLAHLLGP